MIKRTLALGASVLAIVAGSVVVMAAPATASASFSPTTGLTPGTVLNNVTMTAAPGDFLCGSETTEATTNTVVEFGLFFVSSADTVLDDNDAVIGVAYPADDYDYIAGVTTSPVFDLEVPVLFAHDPANNVLAEAFCFVASMGNEKLHGTTLIEYSDVTMAASTVAVGGTATIKLTDATEFGQSCDAGFNEGPYSLGFEIYPTFAAYDNGDEPVVVIPEGWDNDGPGFGSFTESQLPGGVEGSFTVPATLAAGSYVGVVFCINELGFWGDSVPMGMVPFSVGLADTGVSTAATAGIAALGASLLALGGIFWVLRRRSAKA